MSLNSPVMADSRRAAAEWLTDFLRAHGGASGTVHVRAGDELLLIAAHNIPAHVQQITAVIPRGKGMAGLAFARVEPVQTCNLQTDETGDVRSGARAVAANAAVALPVTDAAGEVRAIVGIAFDSERDIPPDELTRLIARSAGVPIPAIP